MDRLYTTFILTKEEFEAQKDDASKVIDLYNNLLIVDGQPIYYDYSKSKFLPLNSVGTTEKRPSIEVAGFQYFDTTINKPIWWNGSKWVDATGADV